MLGVFSFHVCQSPIVFHGFGFCKYVYIGVSFFVSPLSFFKENHESTTEMKRPLLKWLMIILRLPHMSLLVGWPAGTDAANIVKSTLDSTGVAVLPMRTFRNAGVHVWVVACEKEISAAQFSIDINGHVHQVLIQQITSATGPKGAGKGTCKGVGEGKKKGQVAESPAWSGPIAPSRATSDDSRLDNLEARFDRLESRQQQFEGKVDSKFDSISDALRQLLANTNPRAREPSGETPPFKAHKGS